VVNTIIKGNAENNTEAIKDITNICQKIKFFKNQLYHLNKLHCEIQVMESFLERQYQTVLFTNLIIFSANYSRIQVLFNGILPGYYWTLLVFNWLLSAWGIVHSIIKYKDSRRYPVSPGILGQFLQIVVVATLVVGRIIFVTLCLNNIPQLHPVGVILQLLCIYLFNRFVLKRPASIKTVILPSLSPAFYKPEKIKSFKNYGGILIAIFYEVLTIFIFSVMKYVILAVYNSPETIEDTSGKPSMSKYVLKIVFQRYVKDCSIGEMIGFWMSLVLIHALFLWVYYKNGHPYKVVLGGKRNRKSKCTGSNTNN
jgi:hypothetical protein